MKNEDEKITLYLIKNTSNEKKMLVDFFRELYDIDSATEEYPFFRVWTDTYGVWPREYEPGQEYEVRFFVNVCILGRLMNKISNSGNLPSFKYVKIKDDKGYLLANGERLDDPYKTALGSAREFLEE
jgi:hypothetical protein